MPNSLQPNQVQLASYQLHKTEDESHAKSSHQLLFIELEEKVISLYSQLLPIRLEKTQVKQDKHANHKVVTRTASKKASKLALESAWDSAKLLSELMASGHFGMKMMNLSGHCVSQQRKCQKPLDPKKTPSGKAAAKRLPRKKTKEALLPDLMFMRRA